MTELDATEPLVGVIMGSLSDFKKIKPGLDLMDKWGLPYEVLVASAHRTPENVLGWTQEAEDRGLEVIIAAAGGAAHLPGVVAAHTLLPVIGLPIDSSPIGGLDALYAIVQMPPGIPVATVGIDASVNAAVLALHILARIDKDWADVLQNYRDGWVDSVSLQNVKLREKLLDAGGMAKLGEHKPKKKMKDEPSIARARAEIEFEDAKGADQDIEVRPIDLTRPLTPAPGSKVIHHETEEEKEAAPRGRPQTKRSSPAHRLGRIKVDPDLLAFDIAEQAVELLRDGGIVAVPTDTVYGLAVDASNVEAVERLYELKGRDPEQAITIFIENQRLLAPLVRNLTTEIRLMLEAFWPGPLTVVFERRAGEFDHLSPDLTLGVRLPNHSIPLTIMQELSSPMACSSANPSGLAAASSARQVEKYFGREVDMILDVGALPSRPASTVIDVTAEPFRILREGAITQDQLSAVVGELLNTES